MNLAPLAIQKFFDNAGNPLNGGLLFTYISGTNTKLATYSNATGTPNTNPIVLDFRGEARVWLDQTLTYRFVLAPANDTDPPTAPIWSVDDISAALTVASLTQAILGSILYPRTPEEITAGVVPVNFIIQPGWLYRYGTNTTPGTTNMTTALQNAVNAALKNSGLQVGEVRLPDDQVLITSSIECNDQTATGNYRSAVRIIGAGQKKTRILNRAAGAAFKHTLTQTQGNNSSFSRGLEIAHLEIFGDGSSPATSEGIELQGTYNPWIHDVLINTMGSHGIATKSDARWASSDNYSCAVVVIDRATIISCGGWAIFNQAFATEYRIIAPYFVSNLGGGAYLEGSLHYIHQGSISGNGTTGVATSYGLHFARSNDGTPNGCKVVETEFDSNWHNQVRINGINCHVDRIQCADDAGTGAFRAPVQVQVIALAGSTADSNVIEYGRFRFTNGGAVAVTVVSFDLDVVDGRTVRYNVANRNTIVNTGGVITECSFGTNPNSSDSIGNKLYTNASPQGSTKIVVTTRDISLASGTQVVTGVGFRPTGLRLLAAVSNSLFQSQGFVDTTLGNRGLYYYSVTPGWVDTTSSACLLFRTAAGDTYSGAVSAYGDDGFTITWTKGGTPTGTATIIVEASR